MKGGALDPGWTGLLLAAGLMVAVVAAAQLHGVRLIKLGLIATARASVQLIAVGLVLGSVFALDHPLAVGGVLLLMTAVAGLTASNRIGSRVGRLAGVLSALLGVVTALTLIYVTHLALGVSGWPARYIIPLGGIILGNAMTSATLSASRYLELLRESSPRIEAALSLGASPAQADAPAFRSAFMTATTPVLNAMLIVGIVKLPGIMSGQMLGGSDPFVAAKYQLVVMFMLTFGDGMTALWTLRVLRHRAFTSAWQLRA